jgi:hypothetical protein
MQSAGSFDYVHAGTQIQVICIPEDYLGIDILTQIAKVDALD